MRPRYLYGDEEVRERAWGRKMTFARELAGHYGKVVKVSSRRWELSDGAVVWEYTLAVTEQPLWSRERRRSRDS